MLAAAAAVFFSACVDWTEEDENASQANSCSWAAKVLRPRLALSSNPIGPSVGPTDDSPTRSFHQPRTTCPTCKKCTLIKLSRFIYPEFILPF